MEIVCPSCNKTNRSDPCARCGCELGALFSIRRSAAAQLSAAAHHLRHAAPVLAGDAAQEAWKLHHSPEAARLGFLAGVARGDFETAIKWLQRCQPTEAE